MTRVALFILAAALCGAAAPADLERLRDCPECPQVVVLPGGKVVMGSGPNEVFKDDDERNHDEDDLAGPGGAPVPVTVPRFAIGAYEVTRGQYRAFIQQSGHPVRGGCVTNLGRGYIAEPEGRWDNTGGPTAVGEEQPVTCVDWNDAVAYTKWLSAKTGHRYRLPSEAEFEYALRAGTTTTFFWGEDPEQVCRYGNVPDAAFRTAYPAAQTAFKCDDGHYYDAAVGSFAPNPFGLYDINGNMFEWLADCYQPSYADLPRDGSPLERADCKARSVRGGSFGYRHLSAFRSADRSDDPPDLAILGVGFRVARDVEAGEGASPPARRP